jgi:hypothetical protein
MAFRLTLGPTQLPIQRVREAFSTEVPRDEGEDMWVSGDLAQPLLISALDGG